MKIFRNEKVYVSLRDIIFAKNYGECMTSAAAFKIKNSNFSATDFLCFKDKETVEYFRKTDFIIDYDNYKSLSIEELESKQRTFFVESELIADMYADMSIKTRLKTMENDNLIYECCKLNYMIESIEQIKRIKLGDSKVVIPEECDILLSDDHTNNEELAKEPSLLIEKSDSLVKSLIKKFTKRKKS